MQKKFSVSLSEISGRMIEHGGGETTCRFVTRALLSDGNVGSVRNDFAYLFGWSMRVFISGRCRFLRHRELRSALLALLSFADPALSYSISTRRLADWASAL